MSELLKVLDWGPRNARVADVLRELWGLSPFGVQKWLAIEPLVVGAPKGCSREEALELLRAAGVEVE